VDERRGSGSRTAKRREPATKGKARMNVLTYLKFALVGLVAVIVGVPIILGKLDAKDGATLLTSTVISLVIALGIVNAAQANAVSKVEAQKLANDGAQQKFVKFMAAIEDPSKKADEEKPQ
jgi:hypothetical protein